MFKPGQGILSYLKNNKGGIDLPLDVLRQFQEFEKILAASLDSYEGKPQEITYAMQSYTKLEMMAIALMMSEEFSAVRRCHDDIMKRYKKDGAFDDGVSLMSWVMFNFPATSEGRPIAHEVLARDPELAADIGHFVNEGINSRLGLYEIVKDSANQCHLKELFTGTTVKLDQSLGAARGELALCRVMTLLDKTFAFGHAPGFPAARKALVEDIVRNKMLLYFDSDDEKKSYETMMRLAGPYWFSIIAEDQQGDILNPDHFRLYYRT